MSPVQGTSACERSEPGPPLAESPACTRRLRSVHMGCGYAGLRSFAGAQSVTECRLRGSTIAAGSSCLGCLTASMTSTARPEGSGELLYCNGPSSHGLQELDLVLVVLLLQVGHKMMPTGPSSSSTSPIYSGGICFSFFTRARCGRCFVIKLISLTT